MKREYLGDSYDAVKQLKNPAARCVVTFDQSDYRNHELDREGQRQAKLKYIAARKCHAFYYLSHAPFLFAVRDGQALQELRQILTEAGIPPKRLEDLREQTGQQGDTHLAGAE